MRYDVYLRWGCKPTARHDVHPAFINPLSIDANSPQEAAEKRVAILRQPESYDDVAVVGGGEVRVFAIKVQNVPTISLEPA